MNYCLKKRFETYLLVTDDGIELQNGSECKNVGGGYNDNDINGDGDCSGIDVTYSDETNEKANTTYMKSK